MFARVHAGCVCARPRSTRLRAKKTPGEAVEEESLAEHKNLVSREVALAEQEAPFGKITNKIQVGKSKPVKNRNYQVAILKS